MTLIAHSTLPTFARLKAEGQEVLTPERAQSQDIRELHVGVLNMMPDAALEATERQFLRLIGSSNRIVQFYVHLFSPKSIVRAGKARAHVEAYYEDLEKFKREGLDALIITGANPQKEDLTDEDFWQEFCDVVAWAEEAVTSVMCSCFATHAVFRLLFDERRTKLPQKRWGVYSHELADTAHPLVINTNTKFDAPHSHVYEVSAAQARQHDIVVLAEGEEAGLHLAVTKDFRFVFAQGHPEYDHLSLLKEYKREVARFYTGERTDYPPAPEHYFAPGGLALITEHQQQVVTAQAEDQPMPEFPEQALYAHIHNTWVDTGKAMFNNWLGLVYKITHAQRTKRLMEHLNPENPLRYSPKA